MKKRKSPEGVTDEEFQNWQLDVMDYIYSLPFSACVRIEHELNRYRWLDDLPGKPPKWDEMSDEEKHLWIADIHSYILQHVGEKASLRYYHTTELGRTDQEFEDWWDSRQHDALTMFKQKNYNIEDYSTQRADNGANKRNPPIMPFLIGYFIGSIVGELVILLLDIIGIL